MGRLLRGLVVMGLCALGFGVGCSSGSDSGSGSSKLAEEFCAVLQPCCAKAGIAGDQTFCKAMVGSANQASVEQCLQDYQTLAQSPTFCNFDWSDPPSCKDVFQQQTGTKKPGDSCTTDGECIGNATCYTDFDTKAERCVTYVDAPEGSTCIGEAEANVKQYSGGPIDNTIPLCNYDAGLYCTQQTCTARGAVGADCTSTHECADDGWCENGKCSARITAGSACQGTDSHECAADAYCSSTSNMCEARAVDGEPCQENKQCLSGLCTDNVCKYNPGLGGLVLSLLCP